jgi:cell division septum initiation protein DivIVA
MPLLEDILLRFRRVWAAPGPGAGQSAVPVDLEVRLDDELSELTSALSAIDEEGRSVVQAAEKEAAGILAAARSEAERTIQTARSGLPEVRATRAAARIRDRSADINHLIAEAEKRASDLRDRARPRMQGFVDRAVNDVFADTPGLAKEEHARVVGGG